MANFPYVARPDNLTAVLGKVQSAGVPAKADRKWLALIGTPQRAIGEIATAMRLLGFVDASDIPTERWQAYRGSRGQSELESAIREAYSELYSTYPEAHHQDDEALTAFFKGKTGSHERTIQYMVRTFKSLCVLAEMPVPSPPRSGRRRRTASAQPPTSHRGEADSTARSNDSSPIPIPTTSRGVRGVTININLTLPETKDASVYDLFFEALKKHLLLPG